MERQRTVCATLSVVAFHQWPGAPADVGYLASRHRHLLTIRAWARVSHGDRDVEFHQLQRKLRGVLSQLFDSPVPNELELGARSCEHVADALLDELPELQTVEVWEDGENGSTVSRS